MTKVTKANGWTIEAKIVPSGWTYETTLRITETSPEGKSYKVASYVVDNRNGKARLNILVEEERNSSFISARSHTAKPCTKTVKVWKMYKSAKKMVETLSYYGLTLAQVEEMFKAEIFATQSDTVEEIDPADYAVSVEAQDVAIDSEIENATNAEIKEIAAEIVAEIKANETVNNAEITKFEVGKVYFTKNYADCYGATMLFKVIKRDDKKVAVQYFQTPPRHYVGGIEPTNYTICTTKENIECVYIDEGYTLYAKDLENGEYAGVNATDDKYEEMTIIDGVIQEVAVDATDVEEEIENILDEIRGGEIAIESIKSRIEKITAEFNEVKDTAEQAKAKEFNFLINCANEEITFAKKRIDDALKSLDGGKIKLAREEIDGMIERIDYAEETFDRAHSILADIEEINAEKSEMELRHKRTNFVANVFSKVGKFKIKLARTGNNTRIDENGEYTCTMTDKNISDNDLYYIELNGKFKILLMIGLHDIQLAEYDNEADTKKAIIAMAGAVKRGENIFTFPVFKSTIDWTAVRQDLDLFQRIQKMKLLKKFQVEVKKFIKLGELDIAENIFTVIKTILKKFPADLVA